MTEQEAIKIFKDLLDVPCEMLVKYDSVTNEEQKKSLVRIRLAEEMAIEALEELKEYKLKEFQCHLAREEGISIGYKNAIDDFVKECEAEYDNDGCPNVADYLDYKISIRDLCKIAEQLRAGGIDGNERADT